MVAPDLVNKAGFTAVPSVMARLASKSTMEPFPRRDMLEVLEGRLDLI